MSCLFVFFYLDFIHIDKLEADRVHQLPFIFESRGRLDEWIF